MLSLLVLFSAFALSRHPKYNVEMVQSAGDLPRKGTRLKIPGDDRGLVCVLPDKLRTPYATGDPADLLSSYDGKCIGVTFAADHLDFCVAKRSHINGISLGIPDGYIYTETHELSSITERGAPCQGDQRWTLKTRYLCDATSPQQGFDIPTIWKSDNCTVNAVMKTPVLCRHVDFSNETVMNIKCVTKEVYSRGKLKGLF
jgi:hypothetical protein